jgi:rhodanese-related sulfurtransferase
MIRSVHSMIEEANASITTYSVAQARELHGHDDVQFIDIRDVRELERDGVIPGAYHAPRGMLEFWVDPQSPYHKPLFASGKQLVLFCAGGLRSALSAKTLQDMGLAKVAHMAGGFGEWKAAGAPVAQKAERAVNAVKTATP